MCADKQKWQRCEFWVCVCVCVIVIVRKSLWHISFNDLPSTRGATINCSGSLCARPAFHCQNYCTCTLLTRLLVTTIMRTPNIINHIPSSVAYITSYKCVCATHERPCWMHSRNSSAHDSAVLYWCEFHCERACVCVCARARFAQLSPLEVNWIRGEMPKMRCAYLTMNGSIGFVLTRFIAIAPFMR